jgi:biopolymer transport protein ExbD
MRLIVYCAAMLLLLGDMESCAQPEPTQLLLPKETEKPELAAVSNPAYKFTMILANQNEIYYYSGNFTKSAEKTGFDKIRPVIEKKKKAIGDSLVVFIKASGDASYKNVVDILDEMTVSNIKRYALIELSTEEEQALGLKPFMEQQKVVAASPVVTTKEINNDDKDILLIKFDGNGIIQYGFGKGMNQKLTTLANGDTARFSSIIKELVSGKSHYETVVKGRTDAKYDSFKLITDALKANNLFKFSMVTE